MPTVSLGLWTLLPLFGLHPVVGGLDDGFDCFGRLRPGVAIALDTERPEPGVLVAGVTVAHGVQMGRRVSCSQEAHSL